jgi:hypothetical protein
MRTNIFCKEITTFLKDISEWIGLVWDSYFQIKWIVIRLSLVITIDWQLRKAQIRAQEWVRMCQMDWNHSVCTPTVWSRQSYWQIEEGWRRGNSLASSRLRISESEIQSRDHTTTFRVEAESTRWLMGGWIEQSKNTKSRTSNSDNKRPVKWCVHNFACVRLVIRKIRVARCAIINENRK